MFNQQLDWIFFCAATTLKFLIIIVTPIVKYIYGERPPRVPPAKNPLLQLSACTIARKIRLKEISSRHVVQAYIDRIKEVNPIINAVVEERFEAALKDAIICDQNIKDGKVSVLELEKSKPFYGVPFSVKETCTVKGMSQTGGSMIRKGMKAAEDGEAVALLRKSGGIPLCVTNTPELCAGFDSSNHLAGRTCNAYDTRCTAGGSSGGEGAIIGTGSSLIGIGSDVGGSVRVPALFNGIFGHKPTSGVVPIIGHYPFYDEVNFKQYLVLGPMARYAEDLHLAMKVLSVKSNRDLHLDDPVDFKKLKVFYLEDIGDSFAFIPTISEIRACIKKAAMYLKDCGSTVQKYPKDSLLHMIDPTVATLFSVPELPIVLFDPDDPKKEKGMYSELFKSLFGLSQFTRTLIIMKFIAEFKGFMTPWKISEYKTKGREISKDFQELLGDDGVFIFPTFPVTAPIGRTIFLYTAEAMYCSPWNINGFPSTHVPMGLNKEGMPIGFQVIAAPYQDRLCLAVAKELEKHFGGWIPPY